MPIDLDATLRAIEAAPFEPAALRRLISDDVVDALVSTAKAEQEPEVQARLIDALERTSWLFAENERLGVGPRHPRSEDVMVASATLRAARAETSGDGMDQSALNVVVRGLKRFPSSEGLVAVGRRIFIGYGERTGERLSLEEAYFPFSPQEPPSPLAAQLRAELEAHADAEGWQAL